MLNHLSQYFYTISISLFHLFHLSMPLKHEILSQLFLLVENIWTIIPQLLWKMMNENISYYFIINNRNNSVSWSYFYFTSLLVDKQKNYRKFMLNFRVFTNQRFIMNLHDSEFRWIFKHCLLITNIKINGSWRYTKSLFGRNVSKGNEQNAPYPIKRGGFYLHRRSHQVPPSSASSWPLIL